MTELEDLKAQLKVLEKKISSLEEPEQTKSPVEEAYKRVYGFYPETHEYSWDDCWRGFQDGYIASQKDYKVGEFQEIEEKQKKLEELEQTKSPVEEAYKRWMGEYPLTGPSVDNIDDVRWRAFQVGYNAAYVEKVAPPEKQVSFVPKEIKELVDEGEEHENENPLDWLTPKTPEETAESLREAFVKAQQTEKKNKPTTLKELLWEWWVEIFTADFDLDADASIDVLVDRIEEILPKEHDTNSYKWNQCIRTIKEKLR